MKREILSDDGCVVIISPSYRWHVGSQSHNPARMQTSRLDFKAGSCAHLNTLTSPMEAKLAETTDLATPWLTGQRHRNIRCG